MLKSLKTAAMLTIAVTISASAQLLPYYSSMPKVSTPWGSETTYDTILLRTWEGVKKRNVAPFPAKMVHRPKSEFPGDAVSEGISYGMLLALYCNDKPAFDSIWNAGERHMWNSEGYYDWHRDANGGTNFPGTHIHFNGAASDADQDIALLLIFAERLVQRGIWTSGFTSMRGATYGQRARAILGTIRGRMIDGNGYLMPGLWGGSGDRDIINPGYFAPAFYRVFAEYEPSHASTWNALIDRSYDLIEKSPGYSRGLLPDWCTSSGGSTPGGAGYNAYFGGDAMYRDAIRIYWRLGVDYMWYPDKASRAKTFLDNAMAFIESKGGPDAVNFYRMNGDLLPENDVERLAGATITRSRREHSHLTAGMWAAAAIATGNLDRAKRYGDKLLEFYTPGTDYWGHPVDASGGRYIGTGTIVNPDFDPNNPGAAPSTISFNVSANVPEDTARNEMYFDQFLAWFGASMLGGVFTNVWEDLKDGIPEIPVPAEWVVKPSSPLSGERWNINASVSPLVLDASDAAFNRAVNWTVTVKHEETGQTAAFSRRSAAVDVAWYGLNDAGNDFMPQGSYILTISAQEPELEHDVFSTKVWLGRAHIPGGAAAQNLRDGNRLLVDDFADGDLIPYIGSVWRSYLDADDHAGSSTGVPTVVVLGENGNGRLNWQYTLSGGDPYAALEWSYGSAVDMRGIDTIIVAARSGSGNIGVSVQLISTDFNFPHEYQYFEDSLRLGTTMTTYRLPISNFRQRMDGSGKDIDKTMETLRAIRFHMQSGSGSSGTIILDAMHFAGSDAVLSRLYTYTPPKEAPDYIEPPEGWEPVSVKHRVANRASVKYSIKRSGGTIRITLPENMAGSNVAVMDVRGRVVRKMTVAQTGRVDINARNLPSGMYFVEVKKPGVAPLRVQLGNVR